MTLFLKEQSNFTVTKEIHLLGFEKKQEGLSQLGY